MTIDRAQLLGEAERQQGEEDGEHPRADAAHEVELQKVACPPHPFELGAEHPERQHVEEQMDGAAVQEHVRRRLPDAELPEDSGRDEPQPGFQEAGLTRIDRLGDEDRHVRRDEGFHRG